MSKRIVILMLLNAVVVSVSYAQNGRRSSDKSSGPPPLPKDFLYDDDGGSTQVVLPDFSNDWNMRDHGGPVVHKPLQNSIFLGSVWAEPALRARELKLSDLSADAPDLDRARLAKFGVYLQAGAFDVDEDFSDDAFTVFGGNKSTNDLQIQRHLAQMLARGELPIPHSGTIYVVYLPPGVQSALEGRGAGKDYVAYHNFFYSSLGLVRYAVVPFEADSERAHAIAWRAWAETALNPTGQGWY